jgi:hypothetical protein
MGKKDDGFKGGSVANERLAHRGDRGWESPRDERRAEDFDAAQAAADAARIASRKN